jgi:adenylylsulfate kinase
MIIQILGLPGSGKTTLALALKERINAIHLNADDIRATVHSDLGFSHDDRIENARRLGAVASLLSKQGHTVIVDFVCPTSDTREAFGAPDIKIVMDTIEAGRFADTNALWEPVADADFVVQEWKTADKLASKIIKVFELFDWSAPTTLMLGRYQPWHEGHAALKDEAHKRTPQVFVGIRNTYNTSVKDPLTYDKVDSFIPNADNTLKMRLPNITNIVYGRDVGYLIEKVELGATIEAISATDKRKELGI